MLGGRPRTVERHVKQGLWLLRRLAKGKLHGLESSLPNRFLRSQGNADEKCKHLLSEFECGSTPNLTAETTPKLTTRSAL